MQADIDFTDAAAAKVRQLALAEGDPELRLRVYITGGGCSGFQYGFAFESAPAADDFVASNDDVELVIDPMSYQYLAGAAVDYSESLSGAKFVIVNPNAQTTCGCGASFGL